MKKPLAAVAILVILAGLAIPAYLFLGSKSALPETSSVPVDHLAPASLSYYAEAQDLRSLWAKMEGSPAVRDFEESSLWMNLEREPDYRVFIRTVEDLSRRAEYELNGENVMKLVGLECGVGWTPDHQGQGPAGVLLTRLDTAALYQDLLQGDANLVALWDELRRRGANGGLSIETTELSGYTLAAATSDGETFHGALVDDVLVLATSEGLLREVVGCRIAEGGGSLGKSPGYASEVKRLPARRAAHDWVDLAAMRTHRETVITSMVDSVRENEGALAASETEAALGALFDTLKGADHVARAVHVPQGNLYEMDWEYSRDAADIYGFESVDGPLSRAFAGKPSVYLEGRDAERVLSGIERSSIVREMGKSELFAEGRDKVTDELVTKIGELVPIDLREMGLQTSAESAAHEASARFATRMGGMVVSRAMDHLLAGDGAIALDIRGEDDFDMLLGLRFDVEGCALLTIGSAAEFAGQKHPITRTDVGAHVVYTHTDLFGARDPDDGRDGPKGIDGHMCLAGDLLLMTNSMDLMRGALELVDAGLPVRTGDPIEEARGALGGDPWGFAFFDFERLRDVLLTNIGDPALTQALEQSYLGGMPAYAAFGCTSADDFEWFRVETVMPVATEGVPAEVLDVARAASANGLRSTKLAPRETILHLGGAFSATGSMDQIKQQVGEEMWVDFREQMAQIEEPLGMSVENQLIPAFGDEIALSFVARSPDPAPGTPPDEIIALPGIVVMVEVSDAATVQRLLDRVVELADEAAREQASHSRRPPERILRKERLGSSRVVRVLVPEDAQRELCTVYTPVFGMVDGMLVLASDVELFQGVQAAAKSKGANLTDSGLYERAVAVGMPEKSASVFLLDWNRVLNQFEDSTAALHGMSGLTGANVPFPEYPENGDGDEWNRRMEQYQEDRANAARGGVGRAKQAINALRVLDLVTGGGYVDGEFLKSSMTLRFVQ